MKATAEIIGLRIISIAEGTQVGTVKDYILNPQQGTLDFFVVDQTSDYFGAKVISFEDIVGLGEFALTISNPEVIQSVADCNEAQELIRQGVKVIGTKVLTKKGALIGEVKEVLINEETGKIVQCLITDNKEEERPIEGEHIITFGKELLIIERDPIEMKAKASDEEANEEVSEQANEKTTDKISEEREEVEKVEETEVGTFNLFERRQLQYIIGKSILRDIVLDNGEILQAGEPITEEIIGKIATRSKLMEITSLLQED